MIGNGVGIAPMKAFCQEAGHHFLNKSSVNNYGTLAVFFGTKTKDDKLFDSDFETSQRLGVLDSYIIAFSRETDIPKLYAQDVLLKNEELVTDLLLSKNGIVYVCGSNPLRKGITAALEKIFKAAGQDDALRKLVKDGRIMFECFGG